MARRKKMGKIGTGGWIAIAAGGAAVLYLVTRPKTTTTQYPYPTGGYYLPSGSNTTTTIANDATSIANSIIKLFQ